MPSTKGEKVAGLLAKVTVRPRFECWEGVAEAHGGGEGAAQQGDGGEQARDFSELNEPIKILKHLLGRFLSSASTQREHRANRAEREEGSWKRMLQPAVCVSVAKQEVAQGSRAALVEERHE